MTFTDIPKEAWAEAARAKLISEYEMKISQNGKLIQGICPDCGQKELWAPKSGFEVKCNRAKCNFSEQTTKLFPEIAEELKLKYAPDPNEPLALATAYIKSRGLDPDSIKDLYNQSTTREDPKDPNSRRLPVLTMPLPIDTSEKPATWARLIDYKGSNKARFWGNYAGKGWHHPEYDYSTAERIWIVEGIFDALSLLSIGEFAIASLSSANQPTDLIEEINAQEFLGEWIIAYDQDPPDKYGVIRSVQYAVKLAKKIDARIGFLKTGEDFNDLLKLGKLNEEAFEEILWRGRLLTAEKPVEYGIWLYQKFGKTQNVFNFDNRTYAWAIDEAQLDKEYGSGWRLEIKTATEFDDVIELAGKTKTFQIANIALKFLYCESHQRTREILYFFKVNHSNGSPASFISLEASQFATSSAMKVALLTKAAGSHWRGNQFYLDFMTERWMAKKLDVVRILPWVGYDDKTDCYVFPQIAYAPDGSPKTPTGQQYYVINKERIKLGEEDEDYPFLHSDHLRMDWVNDFSTTYGWKGLTALAFFAASLFAEQFRKKKKAFPFMSLIGLPGTGKTSLLMFLWRLFGRPGWEGITLSDVSTKTGFFRAFEHMSNLPTVFLEGDETADQKTKNQYVNMENWKVAYNGGVIRVTGQKSQGNEINAPRYRTSIIVAQNGEISGSPALMERFIRLYFDFSEFTPESKEAADRLSDMEGDLSGFRHHILCNRVRFLEDLFEGFELAKKRIQQLAAKDSRGEIKKDRIIFNNAVILGGIHAMGKLFPELKVQGEGELEKYVMDLAYDQRGRSEQDSELVRLFWDAFLDIMPNYVEEHEVGMGIRPKVCTLNHASYDKQGDEIQINLTEVISALADHQIRIQDPNRLKTELKQSKKFPFVGTKTVRSSHRKHKAVWCWEFKVTEKMKSYILTVIGKQPKAHG